MKTFLMLFIYPEHDGGENVACLEPFLFGPYHATELSREGSTTCLNNSVKCLEKSGLHEG